MTERRIRITNKSGRLLVATVLVLFAFAGLPGYGTPATASTALETGTWVRQSPYPSRFPTNGVDMVPATEAWAVAYTDILHTTDGGATWNSSGDQWEAAYEGNELPSASTLRWMVMEGSESWAAVSSGTLCVTDSSTASGSKIKWSRNWRADCKGGAPPWRCP